jgi:2-hydroxy-6-oxonona-2,4-dienedioate hydrolase
MLSRRAFFSTAAVVLSGAWLGRCSFVSQQPVSDPEPAVAEVEKLLAQGLGVLQHAWTDVKGIRMHSLAPRDRDSSDAPVVVLVHGSGLSGRYMIPTAQQLTASYRVYVPDLPGFGDSDKPEKIFTVPELADWLAAWMPSIGLDRGSLLGNSFGCQVIADLAARYPEGVERAILQGPTTPPEERSWFWQFIRWLQNQRYNPRSLGPVTYEDYRKCGFRRMYWSFQEQLTDRIEEKAPRIHSPLLVIRGEHDPISNQRWCEQIARLCPHGRLGIIPGVAHTLCYTAPVQLAEMTRSFLKQSMEQGAASAEQRPTPKRVGSLR